MICYVCGKEHKAFAAARIQDKTKTLDVHLCRKCSPAPNENKKVTKNKSEAVLQKYWNAPDFEVIEGGEATTEQILAMSEKLKQGKPGQ